MILSVFSVHKFSFISCFLILCVNPIHTNLYGAVHKLCNAIEGNETFTGCRAYAAPCKTIIIVKFLIKQSEH